MQSNFCTISGIPNKQRKDEANMQGLSDQVIEKLAAVFPEVITESLDEEGNTCRAVDVDRLKMLLTGEEPSGKEYYAFTWAGKRRAELEAARPTDRVLRPDVEGSVRFGETENLYIEGDNLEALKILRKSYLHRVKMIYIDPPYNTGHDFVYRDNFRGSAETDRQGYLFGEDGLRNYSVQSYAENKKANPRYHSDWCSMIYPRLKAAKDFLTEDGVIFISIDDNEVMNLRKICDEIFGESNFVAQLVVKRRGAKADSKYLAVIHEYILCYARNLQCFEVGEKIKDAGNYPKYDDIRSRYYKTQLLRKWGTNSRREDRPNLYYPITAPDGSEVYPMLPDGRKGRWRWGNDTMQKAIDDGRVEFVQQGQEWIPYEKIFAPLEGEELTQKYNTWIDDMPNGAETLKKLSIPFDYSKSPELITRLIEIANLHDDSIVLDFFAGSSTTAHAVMLANSQDFGHRKFILVQIPDPCPPNSEAAKAKLYTISQIGQERIKRAANSINSLNCDTGFRLLKIDSSNLNPAVYTAPDELTHEKLDSLVHNIKPDRTALDLLFMCITDSGLPLSLPYTAETFEGFTIHFYGGKTLAACFDKNLSESLIRHLAELKPDRAVFRDSCFADSAAKINLEQVFRHYAPKTKVDIL